MGTTGLVGVPHREAGTPQIRPCPGDRVERHPSTTSAWTAGILPTGLGEAIVPLEPYPVLELYSQKVRKVLTTQKRIIREILTCPESTEVSQVSESKVGCHWSNQIYLEEVKEDQTETVTLEEEVDPGEESVTEELQLGEDKHQETEGGYNHLIDPRLVPWTL